MTTGGGEEFWGITQRERSKEKKDMGIKDRHQKGARFAEGSRFAELGTVH